jgi:hypothetical protein
MKFLDSLQIAALDNAVIEAVQRHNEEHRCGAACLKRARLREMEALIVRAGKVGVE